MDLKLDISRIGDIAVVRCRGRIVFGEEADELRRVLLDLLQQTKRIVLNLAWIEYIDSSCLGTIVAQRQARGPKSAASPIELTGALFHRRNAPLDFF